MIKETYENRFMFLKNLNSLQKLIKYPKLN